MSDFAGDLKTVLGITEVWGMPWGLGKIVFGSTMADETWCWQVQGHAQWRKYLKQKMNEFFKSNWNHAIEE